MWRSPPPGSRPAVHSAVNRSLGVTLDRSLLGPSPPLAGVLAVVSPSLAPPLICHAPL